MFIVEEDYEGFRIQYDEFIAKFIGINADNVEIKKDKLSDLREAINKYLKSDTNKMNVEIFAVENSYGNENYLYKNAKITSFNQETGKIYYTIITPDTKLKKQTDKRWVYPYTFIKKTQENTEKIKKIQSYYSEIRTLKQKIEEIVKTLESFDIKNY